MSDIGNLFNPRFTKSQEGHPLKMMTQPVYTLAKGRFKKGDRVRCVVRHCPGELGSLPSTVIREFDGVLIRASTNHPMWWVDEHGLQRLVWEDELTLL